MIQVSKTGQVAKLIAGDGLSNYEKVAKIIQEKGIITQEDIINATSLSKGFISKLLKMLRNEGLVILTNKKSGRQFLYQWVGGTPAIEDELQIATTKHVSASLLAETYDALITDAFALFSVLFDGYGWEVIANIKEGLTDTELHQSLGNDVSLDSIRRILVICDAHNLIKINRIRTPAGSEIVKLFEPLYRVNSIDKNFVNSLMLIRGLASAIWFENENKHIEGFLHPFSILLDLNKKLYSSYINCAISSSSNECEELIDRILSKGYDFAPDFDRVYRSDNWRDKIKNNKNIIKDEKTDAILFADTFAKNCRTKVIEEMGDSHE